MMTSAFVMESGILSSECGGSVYNIILCACNIVLYLLKISLISLNKLKNCINLLSFIASDPMAGVIVT